MLIWVPLDTAKLAEFSKRGSDAECGSVRGREWDSWTASYSCEDENLGVEWQLSMRDLTKQAGWNNWKILGEPELQPVGFSANTAEPEALARR